MCHLCCLLYCCGVFCVAVMWLLYCYDACCVALMCCVTPIWMSCAVLPCLAMHWLCELWGVWAQDVKSPWPCVCVYYGFEPAGSPSLCMHEVGRGREVGTQKHSWRPRPGHCLPVMSPNSQMLLRVHTSLFPMHAAADSVFGEQNAQR